MNSITQLRNAAPEERPEIISALYEKNLTFFRKHHPAIASFVDSVECPYRFDITDRFINIIHTLTGNLAHPEAGLDLFAEMMGRSNHQAWIDLLNCERAEPTASPEHQNLLHYFQTRMNNYFPELGFKLEQEKTQVGTSGAGNNFSPPVVFVGIFHGLHIEYFLENTDVTRILLVEPEPERFEVSCYFLDYEEISNRFGQLPLNIGQQLDETILNWFHSSDKVTGRLWMRVLPGYVSERIDPVVAQVLQQQRILEGMTTSLDNELQGIQAGWQAIKDGYPFLSEIPVLSDKSCIVIVASGPSLANDYSWLEKNRDRCIIFAVHSSVRPLRNHGICPDFQFNIDMHLNEDIGKALQLHRDVPLVGYYKSSSNMLASVDKPLLVVEKNVANPVKFELMLTNTHPSTTTLALSLACLCKPNEIYLLGIDLGFQEIDVQAITGGIHDKRKKETDNISKIKGSFPKRETVFTNPFFNAVRLSIQHTISQNRSDDHICNMSDGACIVGTSTAKSSDVTLSKYSAKEIDIDAIRNAFQAADKGKNLHEYELRGKKLLELFKTAIKTSVTMEKWDWPEFAGIMDTVLHNAIQECMKKSHCLRMTVYERLINDLLTAWYRYLLLCSDPDTAQQVYEMGLEFFVAILDDLEWPLDV